MSKLLTSVAESGQHLQASGPTAQRIAWRQSTLRSTLSNTVRAVSTKVLDTASPLETWTLELNSLATWSALTGTPTDDSRLDLNAASRNIRWTGK